MNKINHSQAAEFDNTHLVLNPQQQKQLRTLLEQGLPNVSKPYLALANTLNEQQLDNCQQNDTQANNLRIDEQDVIAQIKIWQESGLIRRFGLVVKHRNLGFNANAMVVWNVPDEQVDQVANSLAKRPEVSLCYRRPRRLPDWPYNLFCMIHGKERAVVIEQINQITQSCELNHIDKDILFSTKAFKQHGARYSKKLPSMQPGNVSLKSLSHGSSHE